MPYVTVVNVLKGIKENMNRHTAICLHAENKKQAAEELSASVVDISDEAHVYI